MVEKQFELAKLQFEYGIDFEKKTIYVLEELNESIGVSLRLRYSALKHYWKQKGEELKEIIISVNSFGGSIYSINTALDFYDELKNEGILVNTTTNSVCMSAATILLSGGTGERTCTKRTKFMLHDLQIEGIGGTAQQVQFTSKQLEQEQLELFTFYVEFANRGTDLDEKEKVKIAKKWIKKYCSQSLDHYLCADEMLELKLIDKII